jgi:hypothetical protein
MHLSFNAVTKLHKALVELSLRNDIYVAENTGFEHLCIV